MNLVVLIATPKIVSRAEKMFQAGAVPLLYRMNAKGTASSEMLDMLGLGNVEKQILIGILPKRFMQELLSKLQSELRLEKPGSGIAMGIPLTGANKMLVKMFLQNGADTVEAEERENEKMSDTKYTMVAAIVNQGYSEEVMQAARKAGAAGGTVLHSRRIVDEKVVNFWGLSIQEEKEFILIVTDVSRKVEIMKAISESCGMRSDAKGIVFSVPVDSVIGLREV